MVKHQGPDLLDHLAALDHEGSGDHMLMPCMATACGAPILTGTYTLTTADVECPACLTAYGDRDGLRAEVHRQTGRQAPGRG